MEKFSHVPLVAVVQDHGGTVKALALTGVAFSVEKVLPWLSAVVLILTAINLILEIRKKRK